MRSLLTSKHGLSALMALCLLAATQGCDDKKPEPGAAGGGAQKPPAEEPKKEPEPPKPPPDKIPDMTVDGQGVYMGGERANLQQLKEEGPKKLKQIVSKFQLSGKSVTVVAMRNGRTPDVALLVSMLGEAGVNDVTLKTLDRDKKESTIKVVPEQKAGKLDGCTVAVMMTKDKQTSSWPIRGAMATKYPRGMAGPDMTQTLEGVGKAVKSCSSTALVFSGDDTIDWGLTFDVGLMVANAQPPLKITTFVLPKEAPVPGRAVKLGG